MEVIILKYSSTNVIFAPPPGCITSSATMMTTSEHVAGPSIHPDCYGKILEFNSILWFEMVITHCKYRYIGKNRTQIDSGFNTFVMYFRNTYYILVWKYESYV